MAKYVMSTTGRNLKTQRIIANYVMAQVANLRQQRASKGKLEPAKVEKVLDTRYSATPCRWAIKL